MDAFARRYGLSPFSPEAFSLFDNPFRLASFYKMLENKSETRQMTEVIHNDLSYVAGTVAVSFSGGDIKPLLGLMQDEEKAEYETQIIDGEEFRRRK